MYTLLVLFLALLFGILGLISSGKTTFDRMKEEVYLKLNNEEPIIVTDIDEDIAIISVKSSKFLSGYYISTSNIEPSTYEEIEPNLRLNILYNITTSGTYYIYLKDTHNKIYKNTFVIPDDFCIYKAGQVWNFAYTGNEQEFDIPCNGVYKLETWGAQGGSVTYDSNNAIGGYGGYSKGNSNLNINEKLYINVGGKGQSGVGDNSSLISHTSDFGYNGGGYLGYFLNNSIHSGGGGATHIATSTGLLSNLSSKVSDILIVSGGGAGSSIHKFNPDYSGTGGSGGGYVGGTGTTLSTTCYNYGTGGTQTNVGAFVKCANDGKNDGETADVLPSPASFGKGANYSGLLTTGNNSVAGGGGGFYGGWSGLHGSGGGGSGYIGNTLLSNKVMYCYNCTESSEVSTKTISTTCHSSEPTANCSKEGSGHARITLLSSSSEDYKYYLNSPDLNGYEIIVDKNTTKVITINLESLNSIKTKYELFYKVMNNDNLEIKAVNPTGLINSNETKEIKVSITNSSNEDKKINFRVKGAKENEQIKIEDGHKIESVKCEYEDGHIWNFAYTGDAQDFNIPCSGTYKLETWGAQGNYYTNDAAKNFGGYSIGNIDLNSDDKIYVVVGEMGKICTGTLLNGICSPTTLCVNTGGYNGGGDGRIGSHYGSGGGGATHIATTNRGVLSNYDSYRNELLIVSGGGGGTHTTGKGGSAGGYVGNDGYDSITEESTSYGVGFYGTGGSQSAGGSTYNSGTLASLGLGSFGLGGSNSTTDGCNANGGGGGYYGGGASHRVHGSAGGGSGYIGNSQLVEKAMYCYECQESNATSTKTVSTTCHSATPTASCAKEGNGYARITLLTSN